MQFITQQIKSVVRQEKANGHDYLIVPVTGIVEGVLNGELVTKEEFGRYPGAWNGIPAPIGHPTQRGAHVSANSPDQDHFARLYGVETNDNKLKGEIWVDVALAGQKSDGRRLLERLTPGKPVSPPIEVSTAYFRDLDPTPGTFNSKRYTGVARNLRPDHLAILLDTTGACSVRDGCGLGVNECDCAPGDTAVSRAAAQLADAGFRYLQERDPENKGDEGMDSDVTPDVITAPQGINKAEVERSIKEIVLNFFGVKTKEQIMNEMIAELVANEACQFTQEELEGMPETAVSKLHELLAANEDGGGQDDPDPDEGGEGEDTLATPAGEDVPEWAQALQQSVTQLQTTVDGLQANQQAATDKETAEIVARLVANDACPFDKKELADFSLPQLKKLASAYTPADFSGRGGAFNNQGGEIVELPPLVANGGNA